MTFDSEPFDVAIAAKIWLMVCTAVLCGGLLIGLVLAAINRRSLTAGFLAWQRHLTEAISDLTGWSLRRVLNLAHHSVKEAIHRRVLYVFAVFGVLFLFAGWYLDPSGREQVKNYAVFVLKTTAWLTLLVALVLACFSLPSDIRSRTIHTVVTKPVRRSEIVLGRIAGFTTMGTLILLVMGAVSLVFVLRGVDHRHEIDREQLVFYRVETDYSEGHQHVLELDASGSGRTTEALAHSHDVRDFQVQSASQPPDIPVHSHNAPPDIRERRPPFQGRTHETNGHFHLVHLDDQGNGATDIRLGHYHTISQFRVGPPEDQLVARQPIYGTLRFRDREGQPTSKGVNVGSVWEYRSYIEGGSRMAAIWHFRNLPIRRLESLGDHLSMDVTFEVYRTYKGTVGEQILAEITLINPHSNIRSRPFVVGIQEYHWPPVEIPRNIEDTDGKAMDLFRDFMRGGEMIVEVGCATPEQYLGMAQGDLYIRGGHRPFWTNFAKGLLGIWLQMFLIICVGVVTSTFLSGPMAALTTLGILLGGMAMPFMRDVAAEKMPGAVESIVRLVGGQGESIPLTPTPGNQMVVVIDGILSSGLWLLTFVLPDLGRLDTAAFVANGFNIPFWPMPDLGIYGLGFSVLLTLAYIIPYTLLGYISLKLREIAR